MLWWMAALEIVTGFAAGLVGAGPSIFTVLILVHVAGLDLSTAIGTSLVVVAAMSCVTLVPFVRARAVMWKAGIGFAAASTSGAFVAGRLSTHVPPNLLEALFVGAMVLAGVAMLFRRPRGDDERRRPPPRLGVLAVSALAVGSLTGTVGLGGGFAVVPLLVLVLGAPIRSAVGTSLFVIAMDTVAGLAGRASHLRLDYPLAATLAIAACAGSLAGASVGKRVAAELLRRAFAVLMLAAALGEIASVSVR